VAEPEIRRTLRIAAFVLLGAAALFAYLVVVGEARPDAGTVSLVVVGGALLLCLRAMFRMVQSLGRADVQTLVEQAAEVGIVSDRELREEKRRLLRAINELRFDHEMGKLSKADYDTVRAGFELRAVEVMRLLDAGATLHPELAARLAGQGAAAKDAAPAKPTVSEAKAIGAGSDGPQLEPELESSAAKPDRAPATTRQCVACEGVNDVDAKFCKHCGKELAA
jgi:hypothetical protein